MTNLSNDHGKSVVHHSEHLIDGTTAPISKIIMQNNDLDNRTKELILKRPGIKTWLIHPRSASLIMKKHSAMVVNGWNAKVKAFNMAADLMLQATKENMEFFLKKYSAGLSADLTQVALTKLNDLEEDVKDKKETAMVRFKEQYDNAERYKDYPELYKKYMTQIGIDIDRYFEVVDNLITRFRDSLNKRISH